MYESRIYVFNRVEITKPVFCLIRYKTQAGLQERKINFWESE